MKIPAGFLVDFISLDANNHHRDTNGRTVRDTTTRQWKDHAKYKCSRESFNIDTAKLWNQADTAIKSAESLSRAKTLILWEDLRYFFTNFYSFSNVFDCFWPCERMRKHAFAGQNTQHTNMQISCNIRKSAKNPTWIFRFSYVSSNLRVFKQQLIFQAYFSNNCSWELLSLVRGRCYNWFSCLTSIKSSHERVSPFLGAKSQNS